MELVTSGSNSGGRTTSNSQARPSPWRHVTVDVAARTAVVALLFSIGSAFAAEQFPPLYANAAHVPAPSAIIATYPKGTFLENVVIDSNGSLVVTSYLDGKVLRVKPEGTTTLAQLPGTPAGIAAETRFAIRDGIAVEDLTGDFIVALNESSADHKTSTSVWRVFANGKSEKVLNVDGGHLNGVVRLTPSTYLVADHVKGLIWSVDIGAKHSRVWSQDALLAPIDKASPIPAVNGVKIHDGYLYASNMQKAHIARIKVNSDRSAGVAELYRAGVFVDDFEISRNGDIYAATHPYNSVVRIANDAQRTVTEIAGRADGLQGATAIALDRDQRHLFAVTNGGIYVPPEWGAVDANVVRIELSN